MKPHDYAYNENMSGCECGLGYSDPIHTVTVEESEYQKDKAKALSVNHKIVDYKVSSEPTPASNGIEEEINTLANKLQNTTFTRSEVARRLRALVDKAWEIEHCAEPDCPCVLHLSK